MGITFSALIDSRNNVTVEVNNTEQTMYNVQNRDKPSISQIDSLRYKLQVLINTHGFIKITFDINKIKNYLQVKNNLNMEYVQNFKYYNNNRPFQFTNSGDFNDIIRQIMFGLGFIYQITDQYLLIPLIKPDTALTSAEKDNLESMSFLIPNFFFKAELQEKLNEILQGFNPIIPTQLFSKINSIYKVFQNSLNPQLSLINLMSMSILLFISTSINMRMNSINNDDKILNMSIMSDIALDVLDIQINGNNNCNVTSKILTFDELTCLSSKSCPESSSKSCPESSSKSCPESSSKSCPESSSKSCPEPNNTILYISFASIIILFIIIMILLFMR